MNFKELLDYENPGISIKEFEQLKVDQFNSLTGHKNEVDGYNCPLCLNRGFIAFLDSDGDQAVRPCKCMKNRDMLLRAKRSGLGEVLENFKFSNFNTTEEYQRLMYEKATDFCLDDNAHWLFFGGQTGSGKSHICYAICAHYIKQGFETEYIIWNEFAGTLKTMMNTEDYRKNLEKIKKVPVLYIDDLFKGLSKPSEADIKLAFEIINHRLLSSDKITLISSEWFMSQLLEFDEATFSRVYQKCGKYKFSVDRDIGRNYRFREH